MAGKSKREDATAVAMVVVGKSELTGSKMTGAIILREREEEGWH